MAKSRFWQNLARAFDALQVHGLMRAEWHYIVGSGFRQWGLGGAGGMARIRFEAFARRAAAALSDAGSTDLLGAWLEALRLWCGSSGFITERSGIEVNADGTEGAYHQAGVIWRVCVASASYCSELASGAREAELRAKLQAQEDRAKAGKAMHTNAVSAGRQIDRLRKECHLTEEQLAVEMKITTRTVQRHIYDTCPPRSRNLTGYSRLFSRLLKRQIVINNML
jgi:DNA-binding transcriptional regulator YiaG